MLEDSRLRIFVTVVECGNFTSAASRLGISQPAVSQNVAELERILGERLLERSRGSVALTPKGELFLRHARRILLDYGEAVKAMSSSESASRAAVFPLDGDVSLEVSVEMGALKIRKA